MLDRIVVLLALSAAFIGGTLLLIDQYSVAQAPPAATAPAPPADQATAPGPAPAAPAETAAPQPAAPVPAPAATAPSEPAPVPVVTTPAPAPAPVVTAPVPPPTPAPVVTAPLPPERPALSAADKIKGVAAKFLFAAKKLPSIGKAMAIGYYPRGCLQGAVELPPDGPTWEVMRLSRNRNWGHPELVQFLKRFAPLA